MTKELMIVETLKGWFEEVKELYDWIIPPRTQAVLASASDTFVSAWFTAIGGLYMADKITKDVFVDGTWTKLLLSTALAAAATTFRELWKRWRNKNAYDYKELNERQDKWKSAVKEAREEIG